MPLDALPAEYIGTLSARTNDVDRPIVAGGPFGTKVVATVSGATFVGPRINAAAPAGVAAGDWLTVLPGGDFALDVRASYTGFGTRNPDGTASIRTAPRFETGDERYAWLNNLFCVAVGSTTPEGVEYEVYAV